MGADQGESINLTIFQTAVVQLLSTTPATIFPSLRRNHLFIPTSLGLPADKRGETVEVLSLRVQYEGKRVKRENRRALNWLDIFYEVNQH